MPSFISQVGQFVAINLIRLWRLYYRVVLGWGVACFRFKWKSLYQHNWSHYHGTNTSWLARPSISPRLKVRRVDLSWTQLA